MKSVSTYRPIVRLVLCAAVIAALPAFADATQLTMTSSEPATTNSVGFTQTTIKDGFNASVTAAMLQVFGTANYNTLSNTPNGAWSTTDPNCANTTTAYGYLAGDLNRCAYYVRDFAHQAQGAYFLDLSNQSYAMLDSFVTTTYSPGSYNDNGAPYHAKNTDLIPWWARAYSDGSGHEKYYEQPSPFDLGALIGQQYTLTGDPRYLQSGFTTYVTQLDSFASNTNYTDAPGDTTPKGLGFSYTPSSGKGTMGFSSYNEFLPAGSSGASVLGGDAAALQVAFYRAMSTIPTFTNAIQGTKTAGGSATTPGYAGNAATYVADRYNALKTELNGSNWQIGSGSSLHLATGIGTTGATYSGVYGSGALAKTYIGTFANEPNFIPLYANVVSASNAESEADYLDTNTEGTMTADGTDWSMSNNSFGGKDASGKQMGNIQSASYLPSALFNGGRYDAAWKWMARFATAESKGTAASPVYPEVAFVIISDVITQALGVKFSALAPDPSSTTYAASLDTFPRLPSTFTAGNFIEVANIPLYQSAGAGSLAYRATVDVKQEVTSIANGNSYLKTTLGYAITHPGPQNSLMVWTPKFPASGAGTSCSVTTHRSTDTSAASPTAAVKMTLVDNGAAYACSKAPLNLNADNVTSYEVSTSQ